MTPLISVLITTYNYGHFIEEAIESVLAQEFPQDRVQIVVVDDGSMDDTAERVKKYGSRIEYFHQANGGQAAALNLGISKSRGEILALLDADDLFLPGKLARIAEAFERNPELGMVYHRLMEWHVRTNEDREWPFVPLSGDFRKTPDYFSSYYAQPASSLSFRKTAISPLLPIPEAIRMLGDCFLASLIPLLSPIRAIPDLLARYRIHGRNGYFISQPKIPIETRKSRLQTRKILIDAMQKWLVDSGHAKHELAVRVFLDHWQFALRTEGFFIPPPGRFHFFWFVLWENHTSRSRQTWKFTAFRYVTALSALVFGGEDWRAVEEWRCRAVVKAEGLLRRFSRQRSGGDFSTGPKG
ncbi:MAG: glycosyltransferase family 2 protein [Candidatus Acidoferrum typicum]|nr:glycosyltransferase family 2 protein [Candidatus Acidoferrum typicum]